MSELPPWLHPVRERLARQRAEGRLPHGLLLHGPRGTGKRRLADLLVGLLLCRDPGPEGPCGRCDACHLLAAGTHPDHRRLGLPEGKQQIPVDEVRGLIEFVNLSSQFGAARVAVIDPADALNRNAANALLKTLEEPPAGAHLLLVAERPGALPVTIRSRCQQVAVLPPPAEEALAWLRAQGQEAEAEVLLGMAHGAPLAAQALAGDEELLTLRQAVFDDLFEVLRGHMPVAAFSARYEKHYGETLLGWFSDWLHDLACLARSEAPPVLYSPDRREGLRRLASALDLRQVFRLHAGVQERRRLLGRVAVNPQLSLESLLIDWQAAIRLRQR